VKRVYNFNVDELHLPRRGGRDLGPGAQPLRGTVYRGTRVADGAPSTGSTASTLGARPDVDIPVSEEGLVRPGTGGMSVNDSPTGMPEFRRPLAFGGSGKNPNMFETNIDTGRICNTVPTRRVLDTDLLSRHTR